MSTTSQKENLAARLIMLQSNLTSLEKQAADYGGEVYLPISIFNALQSTRKDLEKCEREFNATAPVDMQIGLQEILDLLGVRGEEVEIVIDVHQPPKHAQYLLRFLPVPRKDREAIIGDLEEEYQDMYHQFSQRKAKCWYWCQVIYSFSPYIKSGIKRVIRWSAIGWVPSVLHFGWEYIRKFM